MYYDLSELLKIAINKSADLEAINILIILAEFLPKYKLEKIVLENMINSFKNTNEKKAINGELSYFEIVSVLYYIKKERTYNSIRRQLIQSTDHILSELSCQKYAESAYLILDFISCPYIDEITKLSTFSLCIQNTDINIRDDSRLPTIRYIANQSWFINWNSTNDLMDILKKKEYMLSY
jgi:hypothetical protein